MRFPGFEKEWILKKLNEVAAFYSGGTPLTSKKEYFNGNIPFIRSGEIDSDKTEQFITDLGLRCSSAKLVDAGDILYALYGANSGEVAICKIRGAINQAILCIKSEENHYFIYAYLLLKKEYITKTYLQGGQGNLSAEIIKNLQIKLPSILEQKKIATLFSILDERMKSQKKIIDKLETLMKASRRSIFSHQMKFKNAMGNCFPNWNLTALKNVCSIIGGGTPDTQNSEYWNGNIQWFTPSEVKSNFILKSERTISELGLKNSSARILPQGTVLLTTRATIGEVAIAQEECSTNQGFQSLIVNENCHNVFLLYWIKENKFEFIKRANGSTFPEISKSEIEQIKVRIPDLEEQTKIGDFLSSIDEKIETEQNILTQYELQKKYLLANLFV